MSRFSKVREKITPEELAELRREGLSYQKIADAIEGISGSAVQVYGRECLPAELQGHVLNSKESVRGKVVALDDGTLTAREIAERLGCNVHYVRYVRREEQRLVEMAGVKRCGRCTMLASARNPVWDELCLWCRLEKAGVELLSFYESGAWAWPLERVMEVLGAG